MAPNINDVEVEERQDSCSWPLDGERDIFQARGRDWIQLPDDIHPETICLPEDGRFIHRTSFIWRDNAYKMIKELNEWKRRRGGRRPNTVYPTPKE